MKGKILRKLMPVFALSILTILVIVERTGVMLHKVNYKIYETSVADINSDFSSKVEANKDCLVVIDSSNPLNHVYEDDIYHVLGDLKVNYDVFDISKEKFPKINKYSKMIVTFQNLSAFEDNVNKILGWVKNGGSFMNTATLECDSNFEIFATKMGIEEYDLDSTLISGLKVVDNFMIGSGRTYYYEDTEVECMSLILSDKARKRVVSEDEATPVLWDCDFGKGKFVVLNTNSYDKNERGILSAAYSLMGEYFVYPVINASTYFIDDYPSQIPAGDSKYIKDDYGIDVAKFYSNIWLKDVLSWEQKYGIIHTGLLIENYGNDVKAPFDTNMDTARFTFLGNTLINSGGELGLHGYNHMPLCKTGFDYMGKFDSYKLWDSEDNMAQSLKNMYSFAKNLFPNENFSVYVPPSNILSDEGREVIEKALPNVKSIAASYFSGDCALEQEFGIGDDGIVDTPRIVSGCNISDYGYISAFSELNFHYVQSHFLHPDDVLDKDRGAEEGWESLHNQFSEYLKYIYTSAPNIRDMSGSDLAEAVKRFSKLSVKTTKDKNDIVIELGGFYDEAYLFLRMNSGEASDIDGGTLEKLANNLYLVHAKSKRLVIRGGNK